MILCYNCKSKHIEATYKTTAKLIKYDQNKNGEFKNGRSENHNEEFESYKCQDCDTIWFDEE